ncbi:MAG: LysR family transcriptional regulator, partial [Tumebacillaceae bacterium]
MNLAFLQTFCEVAKWGSFTRAADELGYAQSSVTMQIQKLEETYGVVLVERYGRKMRLTDAGEELLRYAKQMVALYEESKASLRQQKTGTLKIGTIETVAAFYLPAILQTF